MDWPLVSSESALQNGYNEREGVILLPLSHYRESPVPNTLAAFCSDDNIYSVLSEQGVTWSIDDEGDGSRSTQNSRWLNDCKERAQVQITQYLNKWYDLTTLPGNTWIRWCSAVLTAVKLMRRRGESAPDGLINEYNEFLTFLELVQHGNALVPQDGESDARLLTQNAGLTMSNVRIDSRFRLAQIRVIPQTSTGDQQSRLPRFVDFMQAQYNQ